ncbi:kinase-like protein [Hypoxylon crocopeplum]|nr:kinase-like protein [Hypoxylon crocopeplum]
MSNNDTLTKDAPGHACKEDGYPFEPCVACGWTLDENDCANYKSSIKLFYAASTRGAWALGSKFILKERKSFPPSHEVDNLRFLKEKTNLPIPYVSEEWTEDDKYFTITSRIEGETLENAWPSLSKEDRERIARQVANHIEEMRSLTSNRIEAVGGKPMYELALFSTDKVGQQPLSSDEELWNVFAERLTHLEDGTREILRKNMPQCTPYTFTHGDLTSCNIMVKDGNFSGFIDFERAGFFPVWYEYMSCRFGLGKEDKEWKELLSGQLTKYPKAMNFQMARVTLKRDPDSKPLSQY